MPAEMSLWSLLHIESKTQFDSLTFKQASILVQTFAYTDYAKWAAWYEGLPEWRILEDLLGVLHVTPKPNLEPEAPSKPPPFTGTVSPGLSDIMDAQTKSNAMLQPDGRLSKRVNKKYKVYIGTKGKMHETTTIDLSLTGLQLVDSIPAGNDGNLEVALVNSKGENLSLICSIVPDERRNRLKIVRAGKLDLLQQWLQNPAD